MRHTYLLSLVLCLLFSQSTGAQELVVIVNPTSGIEHLTRYQAIDIFLGRHLKLPSGAAAMPIDLRGNLSERKQFYLLLVNKNVAEMSSYWARLVFSGEATPPFQAADAQTALELVATNPNAIAYVDHAMVDKRVKVVLELKP